jgi:drug/metabolite transporter (DMT)-like permease
MKSKTKGILCILFAAFGFSLMSTFVKLSGDLPSFQKAFFRNFVALIFTTVVILKEHQSFIPKKGSLPSLLGRAFFGSVGLLCNFYAIDHLVLADANMLNKLSPFFAIIFSVFLLREKPNLVQVLGVLAAFVGSLCIIKPSFVNPDVFPAIMGLLGGMGAGIAYTFVRKLGTRGEKSIIIIFFFSAFSCLICLPTMLFEYTPMSMGQLGYLMLAGLSACIGQVGITKAYIYAPAKEISVYDYTQVLFAAILGFFFFNQVPDWLSFLGYILICGAGVGMFLYNRKNEHI